MFSNRGAQPRRKFPASLRAAANVLKLFRGPLAGAGIIAAIGFWFLDALFIVIFPGGGSFIDSALDPNVSDFIRRSVAGFLLIALGSFGQILVGRPVEIGLRDNEFFSVFYCSKVSMCLTSIDGLFLRVNPALCEMLGYSVQELENQPFRNFTHPEDFEPSEKQMFSMLQDETSSFELEKRYIHKNGQIIDAQLSITLVRDWRGKPSHFLSQLRNVTEAREAERNLRESEDRFRRVFQDGPLGMVIRDRGGRVQSANARFCEITGYTEDELKELSIADITHPHDVYEDQIQALRLFSGDLQRHFVEKRLIKKNGEILWISLTACALKDANNELSYTLAMVESIDARKKAAESLIESEERLRTVFETIETGTMVINIDGIIQIFNPAAEKIFGYRSDEVIGQNVSMLMPEPDRSQHHGYLSNYIETGEAKIICIGRQVVGLRKNGEEFPLQLEVGEMQINKESCFVGSIADLTQLKSLESQLRQAQKLEAIGQLTGGVAHDFNNLLAVIQGNLSLLSEDLKTGNDAAADGTMELLGDALKASERGADLTQRLLAFSRKQVLQPQTLDLNELVTGMEDMLRRTLGETIDLKVNLKKGDWSTLIDPSQLENALLNLVLNARDAMAEGGRLTIKTKDMKLDEGYVATHLGASAGDYIMLAVNDTGTGMTADVRDKVFDPFFTTKGVGKGSGLGLSMVHGFVKQSGGFVDIYSERGVGTSVKLYLPRSLEEKEFVEKTKVTSYEGGHETILVVEDDEDVRRMTFRILNRLGYRVHQAKDGKAALNLLENENPMDLLLTDLVLPGGMNGLQIAKAVGKIGPRTKVLFMSGYTENAIVHDGRVDEGAHLISKPFSPNNLAAKIREVLDSAA